MLMQFMQPNRKLCWYQVWYRVGILKGEHKPDNILFLKPTEQI